LIRIERAFDMKKFGFALLACLIGASLSVSAQSFNWISTTDNARWVKQADVSMETPATTGTLGANDSKSQIVIDPSATDQRIIGWGGCFNELGWKALLTLTPEVRASVLKALFDPQNGLRFNICRMPIGASDFALDGYSLDDTKDDYELKHFSIDRDRKLLIPYIKAAMQYRPDLQIWASPWSPPGWMKSNGVYHGGHLLMEPKILDTYAQYFARFVEAYQGEGIHLYAVHVQNEPVSDSIYPTCPFKDPEPLRDFIRDYLGPTFTREKVPAQIWLGTMSEDRMPWFKVILDDPGAMKYLSGIGLQYNGRRASKELHEEYPQLPLMETETPCHSGNNNWKDAENSFSYFKEFLEGGVEAYMDWNIVLDETGLSSWHWKQNSPVVIDTKKGTVTYTPEFYLMKHFSAYVSPGALRLKLKGGWSDALAFKNEDGSIVLVVANTDQVDKPLRVAIGDHAATVTIAAHSFNTFVSR
jgi:glucosylceramidase